MLRLLLVVGAPREALEIFDLAHEGIYNFEEVKTLIVDH